MATATETKSWTEKIIDFDLAFLEYLKLHPEVAEEIPPGAVVVFQDPEDREFSARCERIARRVQQGSISDEEKARTTVFVTIERIPKVTIRIQPSGEEQVTPPEPPSGEQNRFRELNRLYEEFSQYVATYIRRLVHSEDDAEDIFLTVWQRVLDVVIHSPEKTIDRRLIQVLARQLVSEYRRRGLRRSIRASSAGTPERIDAAETNIEQKEKLEAILAALSTSERRALYLQSVGISAASAVSAGFFPSQSSFYAAVHRGRVRARKLLEKAELSI